MAVAKGLIVQLTLIKGLLCVSKCGWTSWARYLKRRGEPTEPPPSGHPCSPAGMPQVRGASAPPSVGRNEKLFVIGGPDDLARLAY